MTSVPEAPAGTGATAAPARQWPPGRLRHDRPFLTFWTGQTLTMAGGQVSCLAIPLAAILVLDVQAWQAGILAAAGKLPFLVFGPLAGGWVDRWPRRPVLVGTALARAVVLVWVPVAAARGMLTVAQLYAVAFAAGALALFSAVAAREILPVLAGRRTVEANDRLEVSRTATGLAGPSAGGALVQAVTAPLALLADAACSLVAAALMAGVRVREPGPAPAPGRAPAWPRLRAGLAVVGRHPLLRWTAIASTVSYLFTHALLAVVLLYLVRILHLSAAMIGILLAIAGIGALLGAASGPGLARRLGLGPALVTSAGVTGAGALLLGLASGPPQLRLAWLSFAYPIFAYGCPAFTTAVIGMRRALAPDRLVGRAAEPMRLLAWTATPAGAVLGGALGQWIGLREAMVVAGAGLLLPPLLLALSPVRAVRG
ncbi:MFS transporter [Couchioplanes azureus]|uniref:MFS transporter n=1 Tax=Couchioplanes caeruleus TaxID=56438 RepID=UPI00167127F9|nr:MFS transporter [Couchioplanes caeruleus]GGQ80815.1 MFS transporter [Couchioplanes caeruleus subsp. azureus]